LRIVAGSEIGPENPLQVEIRTPLGLRRSGARSRVRVYEVARIGPAAYMGRSGGGVPPANLSCCRVLATHELVRDQIFTFSMTCSGVRPLVYRPVCVLSVL
jgi:hypothetical protein